MKEGYVDAQIINVLFLGTRGSGKTSARQVIIGDAPTNEHQSSSSQVSVETALVDSTNFMWQRIGPEEMKRLVAVAIEVYTRAGIKMVKVAPKSMYLSPTEAEASPTETYPTETEIPLMSSMHIRAPTIATPSEVLTVQSPPEHSSPSIGDASPQMAGIETVPSTEDDIVRLMEGTSGSELVVQMNWVRFKEQVLDLEFPPVFSRNCSVCIYVINLSETLDQHPMVDDQGTLAAHSNEEILKQHIMTVYSQGKPPPKILIIGTYKDKMNECKETLEAKNERLLELLLPAFSDVLMYYNRDLKELIFPMNATSPYKVADKIRMEIMQNCTPQPNKIPLSCYVLELALRELVVKAHGRDVLSKEECFNVACQLHFDKKLFEYVLKYLDEQGIIFYYRHILPNIVFCNPHVLINIVIELVQLKCRIGEGFGSLTSLGTEVQFKQFRDQGLLTKAMLESFSKHYVPGLFTATELIKLFKALLVMTNYSDSTYVMPCLLRDIGYEEVAKYRVDSASPVSPLLLHSPHGPRNGTFCSLITFLLSSENHFPHPWTVRKYSMWLFRNCVRFIIPSYPCSITLINSLTFLEVHISVPSTHLPKLCPVVREAILTGLKKADIVLGYSDSKPELAFICPCQKGGIHPAIPNVDKETFSCSRQTEMTMRLGKHYMVWLQEIPTEIAGNGER